MGNYGLNTTQNQLVSFWGGPVTWVERLCLASMLQQGHRVAVYSYDPDALEKLKLSVEARDARQVSPETDAAYGYYETRSFAMFANLFRLGLQQMQLGTWVDLDCYLLKPLQRHSDYIFGYSSNKKLNNAVLRLPAECSMIKEYIQAITADPLHTPWSTFRRRAQREVEILFGRTRPKLNVRTNIGPRALTYFAKKHDVIKHALPIDVFYAIKNSETHLLFEPKDEIESRLTQETLLVHLWRGRIKKLGLLEQTPSGLSYLGKLCKQNSI